jgi:hypothetical protein
MKTSIRLLACALFALLSVLEARAEPGAKYWYEMALAEMGDMAAPLSRERLIRGAEAIAQAKAVGGQTERECELIDAVAQFYHRHGERSHDERLVHYERALSRSRRLHPDDPVIGRAHDRASAIAMSRARERAEAYARSRGAVSGNRGSW